VARRLIGLDIGTNAVTIAEVVPGTPPRLARFGQVALPRDAMREGEVVDDAAVTDAIRRLKEEVDVKRVPVRVGIVSPRVIVRQVEMPVMSREELASALKFQAGDLIPIPLDEAVLDFAILGTGTGEDGEPVMRVLLAAAQAATVSRLVAAVDAAGMSVAAVDLIPIALIRALAAPASGEEDGAEGIVSFGGGVTSIAVHESGTPRFVRAIGAGGRELTDLIASELDIPFESAEAVKRQLGTGNDDLVVRASAAIERRVAMLLDEVRSSIDYYRNQPGAARLVRVVLTGGGSQLPGLAERLAALLGVRVELARPRELLAVGDIGFAPEDYPRLDAYLPGAVGLALGSAAGGTAIDLLPRGRTRAERRSPSTAMAAAAAAALLVLLAVPTVLQRQAVSDKKDDLSAEEERNEALRADVASKATAQTQQQQLQGLRTQVVSLLETDVSWAGMLNDISATMPPNVWLTSFDGQVTQAPAVVATTTEPSPTTAEDATEETTTPTTVVGVTAPTGITGTVSFEASALDFPDVAAWLKQVAQVPALRQLWVSQAARSTGADGDGSTITFSSQAELTDAARSGRLEQFENGQVTP